MLTMMSKLCSKMKTHVHECDYMHPVGMSTLSTISTHLDHTFWDWVVCFQLHFVAFAIRFLDFVLFEHPSLAQKMIDISMIKVEPMDDEEEIGDSIVESVSIELFACRIRDSNLFPLYLDLV